MFRQRVLPHYRRIIRNARLLLLMTDPGFGWWQDVDRVLAVQEGFRAVMWLDPMPTDCPSCGGRFPIPVAALRSLRAACPGCCASLSATGERMLAQEARFRREVDPFLVAFDLSEQTDLGIPDSELDAVRSLDDLARAVASRLPPAADREARAAELVAEAARRSDCGYLLVEEGAKMVRAWLGLGTGGRAKPLATPDRGGIP